MKHRVLLIDDQPPRPVKFQTTPPSESPCPIYPEANYTGHDWDDVLGMYYAKARFYDPAAKRFVSMDPIKGNVLDPLSLVSYLYCVDNPLKYIDPLGESFLSNFFGKNKTKQSTTPSVLTPQEQAMLNSGDIAGFQSYTVQKKLEEKKAPTVTPKKTTLTTTMPKAQAPISPQMQLAMKANDPYAMTAIAAGEKLTTPKPKPQAPSSAQLDRMMMDALDRGDVMAFQGLWAQQNPEEAKQVLIADAAIMGLLVVPGGAEAVIAGFGINSYVTWSQEAKGNEVTASEYMNGWAIDSWSVRGGKALVGTRFEWILHAGAAGGGAYGTYVGGKGFVESMRDPNASSTERLSYATDTLGSLFAFGYGAKGLYGDAKGYHNKLFCPEATKGTTGNVDYLTQPQKLVREGQTPTIGKMVDLNNPENISVGDFRVADFLPDQGTPKLNWKQNSGILRSVMSERVPIKDVSPYPMEKAGFLGAERNLLQSRGWIYREGFWYPPQ